MIVATSPQAKGRAVTAAKAQSKVRRKMRKEAETRADRLRMSSMAADRAEFTVNKVPTLQQERIRMQDSKSYNRRRPGNRPNAKKGK